MLQRIPSRIRPAYGGHREPPENSNLKKSKLFQNQRPLLLARMRERRLVLESVEARMRPGEKNKERRKPWNAQANALRLA
jgi:hypothetical protein